ncbi:uncharacterized protein LOC115419141 [Sphaeramia orbicularis]|uniref:uncharacterized protein LOC115419141 n=1 Tax=Sphaeramia orbicularis TaxID=375764 RepID=UPI0011810D53|nr:uncharacterized protein LOC115419141 [Sphaeramia orbicularis]
MRAGMGTILQERVPQQCLQRVSTREAEWKKKAPWSNNNRPNATSNKMGRRQSQRKPLQPQYMLPSQENNNRLQQRKKHKPHTPSTKSNMSKHSAQGPSESRSPAEDWVEPKVQHPPRDQKLTAFRARRHTAAFPCRHLSDSSPDLLQGLSPHRQGGGLSTLGDGDSDSDLSESERLPVSPCHRVPPKLDLRPEVIEADPTSAPTSHCRPRSHCHGDFNFPDFLPPPFNSWSLSQLAVFYNMEGRAAPRPRPVGPLERYLERLLQLEWNQIQTVQEESGKPAGSEVISSCHKAPAAASSRLSSPKCILQCQRAFPLTFLSSLASHSALLSGCSCTLCRIRYSTCSTSCCRSAHIQTRHSRLSPMMDRRGPGSLPKRSYSESRVHPSADRASRTQRFSSPVRTSSSHMKRMQAVGNIRNPVQGANNNNKLQSTARDQSVRAGREHPGLRGDVLDFRTGGFRRRSGSEQRKTGSERQHNASEKRRSGSECRRGGERRRNTDLREIKPDAVAAIMDNLPGTKHSPVNRPNRSKQVEFIT